MHPSINTLWQAYRELDPAAPEQPTSAFHFCDNVEDANICADLVVAGQKRATASSLAELELAGLPLPAIGELSLITDGHGRARAIIRTTQVDIRRLGDVDADFAIAEGEGDLSMEWWRTAHDAYFNRVLAGSAYRVDDDLLIACEHFICLLTA